MFRCAPGRLNRSAGTVLLAAALLSGTAALRIIPAAREAEPWYGLSPGRLRWCVGTAAGDLTERPGGGGRLPLELERAGDGAGTSVSAGGRMTLWIAESRPVYRGRRVRVAVRISPERADSATAAAAERLGWSGPEARLRAALQRRLRARVRSLGGEEADFLAALLLGVKGEEVSAVADEFRRAGTAHLLALSGMHLGALYLCALAAASLLFGRRSAAAAACAAVIVYLWLIGPRPSLLRAGLMCLAATAVYLRRGRRPEALSLLGTCFLLQVLLAPQACSSISFLLSYSALTGIVLAAAPVAELLPGWLPPVLRLPVAVGIAGQLFTAPLLAAVFGRLYPAGVLATLCLAPAVTALLYLGLLFVVLAEAGALAGWMAAGWGGAGSVAAVLWRGEEMLRSLTGLLYRISRHIVRFAAEVPAVEAGPAAALPLALLAGGVLTVLLAGAYAVVSARRRRLRGRSERKSDETAPGLRFAEGHPPFPGGAGPGRRPPLWAELPHKPRSPGEDNRAA